MTKVEDDMEVIRVKNASKSFHNHKVLNDVSLSCEKGKIYGIVGYNGSGKQCFLSVSVGYIILMKEKYGYRESK